VGDAGLTQRKGKLDKAARQFEERVRVVEVTRDIDIEPLAFEPIHLEDGKPLPAQADALFEKVKLDGLGERNLGEIRADGRVTLGDVGNVPEKTANGIATPRMFNLIDGGETAGNGFRQSERVAHNRTVAERRVGKRDTRVLDGILIIRRTGPPHSSLLPLHVKMNQGHVVIAYFVRRA